MPSECWSCEFFLKIYEEKKKKNNTTMNNAQHTCSVALFFRSFVGSLCQCVLYSVGQECCCFSMPCRGFNSIATKYPTQYRSMCSSIKRKTMRRCRYIRFGVQLVIDSHHNISVCAYILCFSDFIFILSMSIIRWQQQNFRIAGK